MRQLLLDLDGLVGMLTCACGGAHAQMDSNALESTIGGSAARRTPLQILVDIEGPDSTFQQDVSDYFCYAQLAQQACDHRPPPLHSFPASHTTCSMSCCLPKLFCATTCKQATSVLHAS